ncbi:transposase [Streptomyces griseoluteus]|uniref:transposase n=1 Tax=Streptomyces griseoluteus TaxID=29306 RepID=UPI0036FC9B35
MTDMTELYASLFTGFSGATHRVRARQYVDGLLGVDGRKTVANIAPAVGGPEDEQRLRRFVSGGAWRWAPVRRALAQAITSRAGAGAGAWGVGPVSIPKTGDRSVGVTRHYSRERGRGLVGQLASAPGSPPAAPSCRSAGGWCRAAAPQDARPRSPNWSPRSPTGPGAGGPSSSTPACFRWPIPPGSPGRGAP